MMVSVSYLRFAVVATVCSVAVYFLLHMVYGAVAIGAPVGWLVENWHFSGKFAQLWIVMAAVVLLRPRPWVGAVIALVVAACEFTFFTLVPMSQQGEAVRWSALWYGLRPALFACILMAPTVLYCWLGKTREWALDSLAEAGDWLTVDRSKH